MPSTRTKWKKLREYLTGRIASVFDGKKKDAYNDVLAQMALLELQDELEEL